MAINFDALPNSAPLNMPPKGTYYATIDKAEMKAPKDPAKPKYLNMQLALKTQEGKNAGKIFDMLFDSNHEVVRYKLRRFIEALELPIAGAFELSDLCKIVTGKQFIVDITKDEKANPPKAVVDVFTNQIYYPLSEASAIFGDSAVVINAPDAADANQSGDSPFDASEY